MDRFIVYNQLFIKAENDALKSNMDRFIANYGNNPDKEKLTLKSNMDRFIGHASISSHTAKCL